MKLTFVAATSILGVSSAFTASSFTSTTPVAHQSAAVSSTGLCMKYKVAVVGGGPSGACAADVFAREKNVETYLIERKLDNAKPCGGAIPLCMIGEFNLPETVVDRKVSVNIIEMFFSS
jgi:geranylgeranyl reductase